MNSSVALKRSNFEYHTPNTANDENTIKNNQEKFQLKEKIGLGGGVAILAGTIVGSGIFVSPIGVLAGTNGSVGLSLVLWVACGVISGIAALCYGELASMFRESGASYSYLIRGYGPAGPTLAFTYAWTINLISRPSSNAGTALTFGSYALAPFYPGDCQPPFILVKCIAAALTIALVVLNYVSVKAASKLTSVLAVAKFLGMGIIIIGGIVRLAQGSSVGLNNFNNAFQQEDLAGLGFTQIGLAFYQGLWSYDGWTNLCFITEEVKNSKRNVPLAIVIAIPLVTVFYVLVNIGYFSVLTAEDMLTSDAVAVTWGYRVLGNTGWLMSLVVCLSTLGSTNGGFLSGGRLPFVAARNGHLPQIFEMATVYFHTPGPSLILSEILTLIYIIPNDFDTLVNAINFTTWLFYGLVIASVIIMRFTHKDHPRPFKVPVVIPVVALIVAVYLVIAPLVDSPDIIILYASMFILCGPLVYFVFVYQKVSIPGMDYVTVFLQQLFNVAPTEWKSDK